MKILPDGSALRSQRRPDFLTPRDFGLPRRLAAGFLPAPDAFVLCAASACLACALAPIAAAADCGCWAAPCAFFVTPDAGFPATGATACRGLLDPLASGS